MTGKTIKEVIEGQMDGWDDAYILKMTDGTMYLLESGSGSSRGILSCELIDDIPEQFSTEAIT